MAIPALSQEFNALDFSFVSRDNNDVTEFKNRNWRDRLYLSIMGGMQGIQTNGEGPQPGMELGLAVGKIFDKTQSFQLSFEYNHNKQEEGISIFRTGASAAYLCNMSTWMFGYNPGRRFEVQFILGGGMQYASTQYKNDIGWKGFGGFQAKLHLNTRLDALLEPTMGIGSSNLCLLSERKHALCLQYGVQCGLRYVWHDQDYNESMESKYLPYYIFYSSSFGAFGNLSTASGSGWGPVATVSVGRWIANGFGGRISTVFSTDTWHRANYEESVTQSTSYSSYERAAYAGCRAELLVDPLLFLREYREADRFKMYLSLGGEVGRMGKFNYKNYLDRTYLGFTGGIHLGWQFSNEMVLFVEPHYTLANYTLPYRLVRARRKFTDQLLSVSMGVEMSTTPTDRKTKNRTLKPLHLKSLFLEAGGGPMWPLSMNRNNLRIAHNAAFDVVVGYDLHPLHSVALQVQYAMVDCDAQTSHRDKARYVATSLQYRFNFTNLVMGYSPAETHSVDTQLCFGPSALCRGLNYSPGVMAGLKNSYHFGEHMSVSTMPQVMAFPSRFLDQPSNTRIAMLFSVMTSFGYLF